MRDMIAAGLPYGELTEIWRNDGGIVQACADIRDGKQFGCGGNLHEIRCDSPEKQIKAILQTYADAEEEGLNPVWDVQTLVPVNEKSPVSRVSLNEILQAKLNPTPGTPGTPFRDNDKVINLQNGYFPDIRNRYRTHAYRTADIESAEVVRNADGQVYVANGELGVVIESTAKYMDVEISSPNRLIRVPRSDKSDKSPGCSFAVAYAITTHKSQGNQWPIINLVLDTYPGARFVFSREAVYTGISRASKRCNLIGKIETAHQFCTRVAIGERKTLLVERIAKLKTSDNLSAL